MKPTATVPFSVTPEAAARIAALDLQVDVDRMVEHACSQLPELDRIEVVLYDRYELGAEPGLAIDCYSRRALDPTDTTDQELDRWSVAEFPPEVLQHVILCYRPDGPHAG
jgi:hypothetical protein